MKIVNINNIEYKITGIRVRTTEVFGSGFGYSTLINRNENKFVKDFAEERKLPLHYEGFKRNEEKEKKVILNGMDAGSIFEEKNLLKFIKGEDFKYTKAEKKC
jgi:hypothetical protein